MDLASASPNIAVLISTVNPNLHIPKSRRSSPVTRMRYLARLKL